MKTLIIRVAIMAGLWCGGILGAKDGELVLRTENGVSSLQVRGDKDDDWRLQHSADLKSWTELAGGPLLSGGTNAPIRSVGYTTQPMIFYRAEKTKGLFDPSLLRTVSLTFTQSNWQTLLTSGRTSGVNTPGSLTVDNGSVVAGAGARYKGNTSFTMGGTKKSVNIEMDHSDTSARLMGYKTINLNNAAADETIMREPLYFNVMSRYAPSPKGAMARLMINGQYWGVYSLAEQENNDLLKEYFPSADGDRWRAPNIGVSGTGGVTTPGRPPGPGGGGGGFGGAGSAFSYLGATTNFYSASYELKSENSTNAWNRLLHAITVLNQTPAAELRDKVEDVFAVDSWLWFLAVENIFADDDSYWNKGADYAFYYEVESGRIHPIEHDGNESFTAADASLSPVEGAAGTNRPMLYKLLPIPELRQRYLAHMRTALAERFHPDVMTPEIERFKELTIAAIIQDTKKSYTMTAYTNDLAALKTWVTNRYRFLTNHAELRPSAPAITAVYDPAKKPAPNEVPFITAQVQAAANEGIDSVWLYWRDKNYGRFAVSQMFDDGQHGDGRANDGLFGGGTTNYPAAHKIHYYIEARSANAAKASVFSPARAERDTYSYRVGLASAPNTPVVINEILANNKTILANPDGNFADWIELRNVSNQEVDLTGRYLSDEPNNPTKWAFPPGTKIPADGYLLVWADEEKNATEGLHASFKLAAEGEQLFLVDTDATGNVILDSVEYGAQLADRSLGRSASNPDTLEGMTPTPKGANQ